MDYNPTFLSGSQVTISLLPVSLSLVHIPRSRCAQLSHHILKQILRPAHSFINVSCNEIELSLFAEHHMLEDFEPIARHDRQRQRSRSGPGSSKKNMSRDILEPVEISVEPWNVLQIDNAGAKVHELSAPLAAAGISILYQSSYMSDFMLVKESRLQEVMSLLGSAGFDLYSSDPNLLTSRMVSPTLSPTSTDSSSIMESATDITPGSGALFARTRSGTDASLSSMLSRSLPSDSTIQSTDEASQNTSESRHTRTKSHSPRSGDVSILTPDLACVGLSDDHSETWIIKIVKLVAFPELILPSSTSDSSRSRSREWYTARTVQSFPESDNPLFEPFVTISTPPDRGRREASPSSSTSSSDGEGYFSHSPADNNSTSSLVSSVASRSFPDLSKSTNTTSPSFKRPFKRLLAPLSTIEPVTEPRPPRESQNDQNVTRRPRNAVGFFSFTRTSEGSSLTTDVTMLAALFPPNERHMVICSGELDAVENPALEDDIEESDGISGGILKCLQIDLRRFGLDKHGLVNKFSRVLDEGGINHMYSSTFKTANLLVEKAQAARAELLLQSC